MATSTGPLPPPIRSLLPAGALAGTIAVACTTSSAAIAKAVGVSFEVDGQPIPIPAFALWTLIGTAVGVMLARLTRDRCRFGAVASTGTALSLVPAVTLPDDVSTRAALVTIHILAAAIVIPLLSQRLIQEEA